MTAPFTDFSDLAKKLALQAEAVAKYLFPHGRRAGKEWCVGSLNGEPGKSLSICVHGTKKGIWRDFARSEKGGDLVDLWSRAHNINKGRAAEEIREYLGIAPSLTPCENTNRMKPLNHEYHRSVVRNLKHHMEAQAYLLGPKRGLDQPTIEYFGLGLSGPYINRGVLQSKHALVAPMRSEQTGEFTNRLAYYRIPGVTITPRKSSAWMTGAATTYWAQKKQQTHHILFVCEGLKDVRCHWQALKLAGLTDEIMLISSSHGSVYPEEWKDTKFWAPWERVYYGQDNDDAGNRIADKLIEYAGRDAFRVKVPIEFGKDWTDFWQGGGTIETFRTLLSGAPVACGPEVMPSDECDYAHMPYGSYTFKPLDVNGVYVRGHLYYPSQIWVIAPDETTGRRAEELQNIVIRSDRTKHYAVYAHALAGTPQNRRILKLTDGTPIKREPQASDSHSWTYDSIQRYLKGTARVRSLSLIIKDVLNVLRQAIWLPYEEDYFVLAFTVPATYVQEIFESVHYLLMVGPPGSGKTQAGGVMTQLCANGRMVGQISAATACRMIDETRGFVAFDDLESIAEREGKDVVATELLQGLKVSYNKRSSIKRVTNVKTMNGEDLNFFGIKLFTNTSGIESVLGTRTIRIQTRTMPKDLSTIVRRMQEKEEISLQSLRNELHCWAFEHVQEVDKTYREVFAQKADRVAEIGAPLRTMARLAGNPDWTAQLELALVKQQKQQANSDDPVDILKEAAHNMIRQGYTTASISHVRLEMRTLLDANFGMRSTTEIPLWDQPEWLGRKLRSNDFVENIDLGRRRLWGGMLRIIRFKDWIVKNALQGGDGKPLPMLNKDPEAFCQGCTSCSYRNAGCEFQQRRMAKEAVARSMHPVDNPERKTCLEN